MHIIGRKMRRNSENTQKNNKHFVKKGKIKKVLQKALK